MAVPPLVGDALPPGRHVCDEAEVEAHFVSAAMFSESKSRRAIWQNWQRANELLRSAVTVHGAWISGSFPTTKINPRDIDVVYIVSEEDRASRGWADLQIVDSFVLRVHDSFGKVVPGHGLLVDSFIINWRPHQETDGLTEARKSYAQDRGYWDDLWSRRRQSPKSAPPVRLDALPVRGYLEVKFDDFQ